MKLFPLLLAVILSQMSSLTTLGNVPASGIPVTPDAMPEAVALLTLMRDLSGHYTLAGQHNPPATGSRNSDYSAAYTGKIPAVWTSDCGFCEPGSYDSILARPAMVQEAIRQHQQGAIISLSWHAVPPTADEPVPFSPAPGADPKMLKSVQGRLLDEQFKDLLTPGTALHNHWAAQVDVIAGMLRQLQDAHVPVLWRPYHEMNGDWFWWGARSEGAYTTAALYRQLFDRLVNHHHLKNLVWVWNVDRVSKPGMEHEKFFPGIEYMDMLGLDVYGNDFAQAYYDSLVKLSQGKPLALSEVGNPPAPEILEKQPLWTYYAVWTGMVRNTTPSYYAAAFASGRVVGLNDSAYVDATRSYRKACGFAPVRVKRPTADFSGTWLLNAEASSLGSQGISQVPAKLIVKQDPLTLAVSSVFIRECVEDETFNASYRLDGSETKSEFMHAPRTSVARLDKEGTELSISSEIAFAWGSPEKKLKSSETWTSFNQGDCLLIHRLADTPQGPNSSKQTLIYEKRR